MSNSNQTTALAGQVTGSCACGRITFQTTSLPKDASACYCKQCAKMSGSGFIPFANFAASSVVWSRQPDVWRYSDSAERGYCRECGSTIYYVHDLEKGKEIGIAMSMIDSSSSPMPTVQKHIFLAEKADWVAVPEDGTSRFDKHDSDFETTLRQMAGTGK